MMIRAVLLPLACLAVAACVPIDESPSNQSLPVSKVSPEKLAEWRKNSPDWYAGVEPFRIIGDEKSGVYHVGTEGLSMYFIPTEDGHIVIDGGMPDQGEYVANAIRKLGYDPADIKILLNSHAHLDHSGGLAALKEISGAELLAAEGDQSALEGGYYLGSEDETWLNAPPVKVDRIIVDGEKVKLGSATLTARITPGHSRGCTSWTMRQPVAGEMRDILFFCSASVAANRLVFPPQYEGIVDDYRKTFSITKDWRPDVFLSNHPFFFKMSEKREKLLAGDPNAFVDDTEFPKFIAKLAVDFDKALLKQKAIMDKPGKMK